MTTTYCNRNDIASIIGEPFILACIDDDRTGVESPAQTAYITGAIERAAVEMNQSLCKQYILSQLSGNAWCKWCNAYLACWYLIARRGNPPPPAIIDEVQTYRQQLAEIKFGRFEVPEQNPSFDHLPSVTNFKPEVSKVDAPIRVDLEESTRAYPVDGVKRNPAGMPGLW